MGSPSLPRVAGRALFVFDCPACCQVSDPAELDAAEQSAGTHDDTTHAGRPTALVRPDPDTTPGSTA